MTEQVSTERATAPPPDASGKGWLAGSAPNLLAVILALALCVGIAVDWDRWVGESASQWTDDACLQGDLVPLSALVAAPVLRVAVEDFQQVHAGDLLVELDPRVYAAQLAQSEANVASAQDAVRLIQAQQLLQRANIAGAAASLDGVQATRRRDELEARHQRTLLRSGITGTEQRVEQADAALELTSAQVLQASAGVESARRQLAVQQQQQTQLEATLKAAEAARDLARINLGYTRITAPTDGMVSRRRVFPGQYVGIGAQVITVAPLPRLYVMANSKEEQLTRLREGQRATITVDSFPGARLQGRVAAWSPGTGSEFALLPPDNATGNFTKVVQRIPVKIMLQSDGGLGDRLRAGMSVEATVDTSDPGSSDPGPS